MLDLALMDRENNLSRLSISLLILITLLTPSSLRYRARLTPRRRRGVGKTAHTFDCFLAPGEPFHHFREGDRIE